MVRFLGFFFSLLPMVSALGATYVVDPKDPEALPTISAAAARARAGDRVVIQPGIYRESVRLEHSGTPESPIVFEAHTPGTVIVTGADPVAGLRRAPGEEALYTLPWRHVFAIDVQDGLPVEHHPQDEPLWGRAEQVIVGGRPLLPVESLQKLRELAQSGRVTPPVRGLNPGFAGGFTVDRASGSLWIWMADHSDPSRQEVLASTRGLLLGVSPYENPQGVHRVHVKGLIFRYGATFPQRPAVWLHGKDNLLEDCLVESMAGSGVEVAGTMRRCIVRNNGHTGGSAVGDGFVNEFCLWEGNSWKPISRDWEAGGAKVTDCKNGVFRDCLFAGNGGPGLWLDLDVRQTRIQRCVMMNNEQSGLMVEISRGIRIEQNLLWNNARGDLGEPAWADGGIKIAESFDCQALNNTCIGNREGITLREQGPREITMQDRPISFYCHDIQIERNLFRGNVQSAIGLWYDNSFFGRHPSAEANRPPQTPYDPRKVGLTIDHNAYVPPGTAFIYGTPWRSRHQAFETLDDWVRGTGFDAHSTKLAPGAKTDAGWADAPDDPAQWMRRQLPTWLAPFTRPAGTCNQ